MTYRDSIFPHQIDFQFDNETTSDADSTCHWLRENEIGFFDYPSRLETEPQIVATSTSSIIVRKGSHKPN